MLALSPVAKNSRLTNSPWGYTGESHDIEAGLVYLRARYYEPGTGRFIQQDKYPYLGEVGEPLTRNLYIYGKSNPVIYTDPSGNYTYADGVIAHKQLQEYFKYVYKYSGMIPFTEYYIGSNVSINRSGTGRADLVLYNKGVYEVYEIKPYNNVRSIGIKQLNSYVNALRKNGKKAVRGTTFKPCGLLLPHPTKPDKFIKYYTRFDEPGMIYYSFVNRKKEPAKEPVIVKEKEVNYDELIENGLVAVEVVGVGYVIYRVVRMGISLIPGLWWSIPANAVTP